MSTKEQDKFSLHDDISADAAEALSGFSDLTRTLLANRGITTKEEANTFLYPDYDAHTHDPFLMKDMETAVERIIAAVERDERVVVFSDYDTDGIPGAVVLHDLFKQIGHNNVTHYIPHRNREGFGLKMNAVEEFIEDETDLLITVDCGITATAEVARANEAGMDVIITDHHLPLASRRSGRRSEGKAGLPASPKTASRGGPNGTVPEACAILNPKQESCQYPYPDLCGAAVAFKLAGAVMRTLRASDYPFAEETPEGWEKWLLDMVGIATVSDMVPLLGENRVLARYGLTVLQKSRRPGLLALLKRARVHQDAITEGDVGYMIGPRINAASRMDAPKDAFRLLATDDREEGEQLAHHLDTINNKRKGLVSAMVKEIKKKVAAREELGSVIVTGNPDWKPSLLGLACNSLIDAYDRPAFLWGRSGDGLLKGSCRAGDGVNLVEIMAAAPDGVFERFGGHAQSGGFVVNAEYIHTLEEILNEAYEQNGFGTDNVAMTMVDAILSIDDVGWETYDQIKGLAPFGEGNPKPVFLFEDVTVANVSHFGKANNHLKLIFRQSNGKQVEAIQFFATKDSYEADLQKSSTVSLLAHIEKSTFGGRASVRLRIVDVV